VVGCKAGAGGGSLGRLVRGDVVDGHGMPIERLAAGGPDVDEVGGNRLAVAVDEPAPLHERGGEIDRLRQRKRNAGELDRTRQRANRSIPWWICSPPG